MTFDNRNRGAIWQNKDKEADGQPDFTGKLNVEGREFWVSAWKRKADAAPKSPALTFSIKANQAQQGAPSERPKGDDEEIPF
jgi:hypothetical protein